MSTDKSGAEKVLDGSLFGYGHWFEPIERAFGTNLETERVSGESNATAEKPKGRGRPRKLRDNDDQAREKRRAQIRSAQKTYRERKERATASQEQRCDELLGVVSEISTELEALLQVACETGAIDRNDDLGERLRQTASCYDSVIEKSCIDPELRLLRTKSQQRRETYGMAIAHPPSADNTTALPQSAPLNNQNLTTNPTIDMDLGRIIDSSLIMSFRPHTGRQRGIKPKTMLELVKERQADLKAGRSSQPVTAMDIDSTKNLNDDLEEPLRSENQ